ncbi:MAG: hypothetical protein HKN60_06135 [Rhizobiales bacterium]|nr:hypothetical protein [Hyphomicrobiales bacterium]
MRVFAPHPMLMVLKADCQDRRHPSVATPHPMKLAILTIDLPEANVITERLVAERGDQVCGILQSATLISGKSNWDAYLYLGRRMGLYYGGSWQAHRVIALVVAAVRRSLRLPAGRGCLKYLCQETGLPLISTSNINAHPSIEALRALKPDLIVSNYFNQVIKEPILDEPDWEVINIHPALLPRNRGLMPCFWALANGDSMTGVTVHRVDKNLDTGEMLAQREVPIRPRDSVISLSQRCSEAAADLVLKVIKELEAGAAVSSPQNHKQSSYYSWPSRAGIRKLYKRDHRYGSLAEMWAQAIKSS